MSSTHHVNSPSLTYNKTTVSSIELFDNQSDDGLSIGEQLSFARRVTISPPMMERSHLCQHPKFHANEASDHDDDSHSDDDNFSYVSVSSIFSFDSNEKHILEEAYDEIIGSALLFQEETNSNQLDDKHSIESNADTPTLLQLLVHFHSLHQQSLQSHQGLHIQLHMIIWLKMKLSSSPLT